MVTQADNVDPRPEGRGELRKSLDSGPTGLRGQASHLASGPYTVPDLPAIARASRHLGVLEPTDDQANAVKELQPALKALGQLCVDVMLTGRGNWDLAERELKEALRICSLYARSSDPPVPRSPQRPSEKQDRGSIYTTP